VVRVDFANLGSTTRRTDFTEEFDVCLVVIGPLTGKVILVVNCLDGANRLASSAVNTLVWVDVKHAVTLIDAVDRAFLDARLVFYIDTGQGDYVGHAIFLSKFFRY